MSSILRSSIFVSLCWAIMIFRITLPYPGMADSRMYAVISEEDRLGARSDEYSRVFDQGISALVDGNAAAFRTLLTSATISSETRGPAAIDHIIKDRFIPFFRDFDSLTEKIATAPAYDHQGHTGLALARSFRTTNGEIRSFVIYLMEERKEIKIGNILLNATESVFEKKNKSVE